VDYHTDAKNGNARITVWDGHGSWAVVDQEPGPDGWTVREHGPRRLWADIETAYHQWAAWRRPSPDRFTAHATGGRMQVHLDEPNRFVATVGLAE
jgi:hypothetical protein